MVCDRHAAATRCPVSHAAAPAAGEGNGAARAKAAVASPASCWTATGPAVVVDSRCHAAGGRAGQRPAAGELPRRRGSRRSPAQHPTRGRQARQRWRQDDSHYWHMRRVARCVRGRAVPAEQWLLLKQTARMVRTALMILRLRLAGRANTPDKIRRKIRIRTTTPGTPSKPTQSTSRPSCGHRNDLWRELHVASRGRRPAGTGHG